MDVVLDLADHYVFTPYVYPDWIPEDNLWRQFLTLNIVVDLGAAILYLLTGTVAYFTTFDQRYLEHPQSLPVSFYCKLTLIFTDFFSPPLSFN